MAMLYLPGLFVSGGGAAKERNTTMQIVMQL